MKLLGLVIAAVVGLSSTAKAGILAEPYLGYGIGSYELTGANAEKGSANAPIIGGRVAGAFSMLFIGGDYGMSVGGKTDPETAGATAADFDKSDLYGVIGFNLPLIRGWAGYGLMNTMKRKDPTGDVELSGGSNFKVGIGFKVIPMLSLNVEYISNDYKKAKAGGVEYTLPNALVLNEAKASTIMVGASVPFEF